MSTLPCVLWLFSRGEPLRPLSPWFALLYPQDVQPKDILPPDLHARHHLSYDGQLCALRVRHGVP